MLSTPYSKYPKIQLTISDPLNRLHIVIMLPTILAATMTTSITVPPRMVSLDSLDRIGSMSSLCIRIPSMR